MPAAVVTSVVAAALVALQLKASSEAAIENLDSFADLTGGVALEGVRDALLSNDTTRVQQTLARFSHSKQVRRIDIVSKAGKVVFSSDPAAVGEEFSRTSPSCSVCHGIGKPPASTGRTIRYEVAPGQMVFRFVQPIVASAECLPCHAHTSVGQNFGILITDLDDAAVTGAQLARGRQLSWALAGAFALLLAAMAVIVRFVVVGRLRNIKRLLEVVREGTPATARQVLALDEIDEIERLVQSVADDLEDRHAVQRACDGLGAVLDRLEAPAVMLDLGGSVLMANRPALNQPGTPWVVSAGAALAAEKMPGAELFDAAKENGWSVDAQGGGPLVVTVEDAAAHPLAFVVLWPEAEADVNNAPAAEPRRMPAGDPEWQLYTAALVAGSRFEPRPWRGVLQLDRRLTTGRRALGEIAALAKQLGEERQSIELRSMALGVLWDLGRQVPEVSWHSLLDETHTVVGARYQLRALVRRLAHAAATQAGPRGHAVLFTQTRADKSKVYVGAWAFSQNAPEPLDGAGKVPLVHLLAGNHGGGAEVDPKFDLGPLCASRRVTLPCGTVGVLFVAELAVAPTPSGPRRLRVV